VAPFLLNLPRKALAPGLDLKILDAIRNEREEARTESKSGSVLKLARSVAAAAAIIAVLSVLGYQTIGSRDDYHKHQNVRITLGKSLYFHSLSGNDLIGERGK
jgi:hypothetical protein